MCVGGGGASGFAYNGTDPHPSTMQTVKITTDGAPTNVRLQDKQDQDPLASRARTCSASGWSRSVRIARAVRQVSWAVSVAPSAW